MNTEENTSQEPQYDFMRDYEELKRRQLLGPQARSKTKIVESTGDWLLIAASILIPAVCALVLLVTA
jgi:hypothetical protein